MFGKYCTYFINSSEAIIWLILVAQWKQTWLQAFVAIIKRLQFFGFSII